MRKAVLAFCVMLMVSGSCSVGAMAVLGVPLSGDMVPSEPAVMVGLILSSLFGLVVAIGMAVRWVGWSFLQFGPTSKRHLLIAVGLVPVALGFSMFWSTLLEWLAEPVAPQLFVQGVLEADDVRVLVFAVFYAVLGAPILEEALFRGFMLPVMTQRLGLWRGILFNSFLFGLVHAADPWAIVPTIVIGVLASWLREYSGSIGAGIAFHATNNLVALLLIGAGY